MGVAWLVHELRALAFALRSCVALALGSNATSEQKNKSFNQLSKPLCHPVVNWWFGWCGTWLSYECCFGILNTPPKPPSHHWNGRFGSEISMFQQTFFANSASQVASHRLWAFTFCYPKQSRLSRSGDKVYLSQENFAKLAKVEELHFCARIGKLVCPN